MLILAHKQEVVIRIKKNDKNQWIIKLTRAELVAKQGGGLPLHL